MGSFLSKIADTAKSVATSAVVGVAIVEIGHFLIIEFGKTLLISAASSALPWLLLATVIYIIVTALCESTAPE